MRDTDPADLRAPYESIYDRDIEIIWVDTILTPGRFTASTKPCGV